MRKKMKKVICMLLMCSMMVGLLCGCGDSNATGKDTDGKDKGGSNERVSITFAGWGELEEKQIFTNLINEFMKSHPNITVKYQHYSGGKASYMIKMVASIANNSLPEAFYMPTQDFAEWAESGRLMDLTKYLEESEIYEEGLIWDVAEKMFLYNSETKTVGEDGILYGLPKDLSVRAVAINKDLFKQKGIAVPDAEKPMTQSEYIALAKKLTSGSGATKTFGTSNYILDMAVWANGASFLSDDKKTVTIDTPEFTEALQWVADLSLVHGVAPSQSDVAASSEFQRFCNGRMAMAFIGPWEIATLWNSANFDWDIVPVPVNDKTGKAITWLDSAALCVSATASDAEAKAAYELIEYISMHEEGQRTNYESGQAIPNIVEMAKTEFVEMDSLPTNRKLLVRYLENADERQAKDFYYTMSSEWYDYFESQVTAVYRGEKTAKEFCSELQPRLQEMLDGSK